MPLPENARGLGVDATNRHYNFVGQLIAAVRAQGAALNARLNTAILRAKEDADPMDEVLPWSREHRVALYARPPFAGCASWKRRTQPGNLVFHDGLFWRPAICELHGLRREEAAGLAVDDIVHDTDTSVWCIDVRPNKFRRLKRTWTARRIPLHLEVLRLKFIEYVQCVRALGYEALFPDLLPARPGAPLHVRPRTTDIVRCPQS